MIEAVLRVERQGLGDHRPRELRSQIVQRGICERNDGAKAVVAAGELDHDQDVVVGHAFLLGRVDGAGKSIRDRRISRGETRRAGAEHEACLEEVAALELVDADFSFHSSRTYLS